MSDPSLPKYELENAAESNEAARHKVARWDPDRADGLKPTAALALLGSGCKKCEF